MSDTDTTDLPTPEKGVAKPDPAPQDVPVHEVETSARDHNRTLQVIGTDLHHLFHVAAATSDRGLQVEQIDLEEALDRPRRTKGTTVVTDVDSLSRELLRRPLNPVSTVAHCSLTRSTIEVIRNEHDVFGAGWGDDVVQVKMQRDPDWAAWAALDGQLFGQVAFSEKLDELSHTLVKPTQADLLAVVTTLRVSRNSEYASTVDVTGGNVSVEFKETRGARAGERGELVIPDTLELGLTPWRGGPQYVVKARLRIQSEDGLRLGVRLPTMRAVQDQAWADVMVDVRNAEGMEGITVINVP